MEWLRAFYSAMKDKGPFRRCFPLAKDVRLNGRRLQILRQLGEGGYSYVYLVKDLTSEAGERYALKRIWAVTEEQLKAAKHEIDIIRRIDHPNLLQMIDSAIVPKSDESGKEVYILFPVYLDGSLMDEVDRRSVSGIPFTPKQVVDIFLQLCQAVASMHSMVPALAHRDIKPQNILLSHDSGAGGGSGPGTKYSVALTDFGSSAPAVVEVNSRSEALALQEVAEAHCTAPYRAPELFDVPSHCVVDGRVDVWALGCVLYYMMYGASPFEHVLGEAGGSLALAVMNGKVIWPKAPRLRYPEDLHALVLKCLDINPATRPHVHAVVSQLQNIATKW